jgi:hypothetical protein
MTREDILRLLQERPFRPFRLRLTSGIVHEIRHPEMAIVTPSSMVLGIPAADAPAPAAPAPAAADYVIVSLIHVVQTEPQASPAAPGSN